VEGDRIVSSWSVSNKRLARLFRAWVRGLTSEEGRRHPDYTLAWAVIVGSLPVGISVTSMPCSR